MVSTLGKRYFMSFKEQVLVTSFWISSWKTIKLLKYIWNHRNWRWYASTSKSMTSNIKPVKVEAVFWNSLASHGLTHFIMAWLISEIRHDFVMETLETCLFLSYPWYAIFNNSDGRLLRMQILSLSSKTSVYGKSPSAWHF